MPCFKINYNCEQKDFLNGEKAEFYTQFNQPIYPQIAVIKSAVIDVDNGILEVIANIEQAPYQGDVILPSNDRLFAWGGYNEYPCDTIVPKLRVMFTSNATQSNELDPEAAEAGVDVHTILAAIRTMLSNANDSMPKVVSGMVIYARNKNTGERVAYVIDDIGYDYSSECIIVRLINCPTKNIKPDFFT